MDKFGRTYRLEIQVSEEGDAIKVELPFTVQFDITRNTLTSANVCQIRVYNLSEDNRSQIRFNISDYGTLRGIKFRAGYGTDPPVIFSGNISQAWSVREGVNFITQIECYDGGFAFVNGKSNIPVTKDTTRKALITTLAGQLPGISVGAIGNYPTVLTRGNSYSGNTADLLREETGGGFFVDLSKANALGSNEFIDGPEGTLVINSKIGLLGTPVLEQTIVHFDMIFEPRLNVGTRVDIQSFTEKNFNGFYKVTAVKHRGMISAAICGTAITTGEFFYSEILSGVSP